MPDRGFRTPPRGDARTVRLPFVRSTHRPWLRWGAAAEVPLAIAIAQVREKLPVPRPVVALLAAAAPLGLTVAVPRSKLRDGGVWLLHMWAYTTIFELPYDHPETWNARAKLQPMLRLDRLLGLGVPPSQRLQRRLRPPREVTRLDKALTAFYWTWEFAPHAALLWIRLRHPERFTRAAVRLAAAFDASLPSYLSVPTAPPWFASLERGRMDGEVGRVTHEVRLALKGEYPKEDDDPSRGANPLATMPSDHFLSAATVAMLLSEIGPVPGALAWAYALVLGTTLVYTGEHYVIDLAAGLAVAEALRRAEGPARPLVETLGDYVRRLEHAAR